MLLMLLRMSCTSMRRLAIIAHIILLLGTCDGADRNKRHLMFPPESIMQLAFAVVTPGEVKNRMLTTNMGVMFNINLPTNISIWYPWRKDYRQSRSTDTDIHVTFYSLIQDLLTMNGLDGRACVLKSFCQMKEAQIPNHDLPHQLLNLIFGDGQKLTERLFGLRHSNTSCNAAYSTCSYNVLGMNKSSLRGCWAFITAILLATLPTLPVLTMF